MGALLRIWVAADWLAGDVTTLLTLAKFVIELKRSWNI
ncbi:hypothetical protein CEXT_343771, partial [Caerostris extrusa]